MPRALPDVSGDRLEPDRKLRTRMTSEYSTRPTRTVVADSPVTGATKANMASDGIV